MNFSDEGSLIFRPLDDVACRPTLSQQAERVGETRPIGKSVLFFSNLNSASGVSSPSASDIRLRRSGILGSLNVNCNVSLN